MPEGPFSENFVGSGTRKDKTLRSNAYLLKVIQSGTRYWFVKRLSGNRT